MKCYNCDSIIEMQKQCPVCNIRIDAADYNLKPTSRIINKITNIKEFASFIGLFYVKPFILLFIAFASLGIGLYMFIAYTNRAAYIVLAVVFAIAFNYFMEMRKIETFYQDFQNNKNHYYILFPFKSVYRTIFCDANDHIPTASIMKKRYHAYENRKDKKRALRFNSFKILHPQKPKLFNLKNKFYKKHFNPDAKHILQTGNYEDQTYVGVEGTVHGFLVMSNSVITIFNTPKITKEFLDDKLLDVDDIKESKDKVEM